MAAAFEIQKELRQAEQREGATGTGKKYVRVKTEYKARNSEELDLAVGDVVEVLESKEDGWCVGKLGGRQGQYRTDCVEEMMEASQGASQAGKGDNLEDLFSVLKEQIMSTDWLKENTAEKWVAENPELAQEYMDAAKKS